MGIGPAFKQKYAMTEPFQNVELYNLFCALMNLSTCAKNNGTWGAIFDVLKFPPKLAEKPKSQIPNCSNGQNSNHICSQCWVCLNFC